MDNNKQTDLGSFICRNIHDRSELWMGTNPEWLRTLQHLKNRIPKFFALNFDIEVWNLSHSIVVNILREKCYELIDFSQCP